MSQDTGNLQKDEVNAVKPDVTGQPMDPGEQAIEDVGSIVTYDPTETIPGDTDPKGTAQEPVKAPQDVTPDQPDQYELAGIKFVADDVKRWSELEKSTAEPRNKEAWEQSLHKHGLELNERESVLKQREEEVNQNLNVLSEYKEFRKIIDANEKIRDYFMEVVKNPRTAIAPEIEKLRKEMDEKFDTQEEDKALLKLGKEFDDFSEELCDQVLEKFDFDKPYDMYKGLYLISKALTMEQEIIKRLAAAKENQPNLPPLAGGKTTPPQRNFGSVEKATEAVMKDLGLS